MHGEDIDASVADFDGQGGGELRHERLGSTIHHSEGVRNVTRWRRSEDEATLQLLVQHDAEEVVGDLDASRGIAFEIRQLRIERRVIEETGHNVTSVIENNSNVNVVSGLAQEEKERSIREGKSF